MSLRRSSPLNRELQVGDAHHMGGWRKTSEAPTQMLREKESPYTSAGTGERAAGSCQHHFDADCSFPCLPTIPMEPPTLQEAGSMAGKLQGLGEK